jgi:hypothetical protein
VIQFAFSLLKIKGMYMLEALLSHPQKALNKRHLVYCVRIMSVGCGMVAEAPEDEQVMLQACRDL